jgi:di/tricarboxylate transporter
MMFTTGLAQWIGEGMAHAFEANSTFGLVALLTGVGAVGLRLNHPQILNSQFPILNHLQ